MTLTRSPPRARTVPRAAACALCATLSSSLATGAAAEDEQTPPRFELTPYVGYRIGGEFERQDGNGKFELDEGNSEGLIFDIEARARDTEVVVGISRCFVVDG